MQKFDKTFWKDIGISTSILAFFAVCVLFKVPVLGFPALVLLGPVVGIFLTLRHRPLGVMRFVTVAEQKRILGVVKNISADQGVNHSTLLALDVVDMLFAWNISSQLYVEFLVELKQIESNRQLYDWKFLDQVYAQLQEKERSTSGSQ